MKSVFKTVFFVSLSVVLLCASAAVITFITAQPNAGAVGIIGGADGPTAMLVTWSIMSYVPFVLLCGIGVLGCIASAIGWAAAGKRN